MKQAHSRRCFWLSLCLCVWAAVSAAAGDLVATDSQDAEESSPARAGVLVELFTSQGCSSCPPADRFLTELAEREDLEVIALSFHVDYWNYIGWTDPFSSAAWSQRQRRYARVFGGNRIYTPQMVIDGRWEGVGSSRSSILSLIERARDQTRQARIDLSATLESKHRIKVEIDIEKAGQELGSKSLEAWVAVVESELTTPVGRGENASKSLRNDRVVRHLERLPESVTALTMPLEEGWRRDRLRVVTFLQDAESLRVLAAVESALAK